MGSIKYLGSSYPCLVEEISERGIRLLSRAPVDIGDRVGVDLQISQDVRFSCVIEIRDFTGNALRGEIVAISDADACVLRGRLEEHYSNIRLAKAADAQRHLGRNG